MNGVVALKNRQALTTGERDKSGSNPWLDILIVTIFCAVVLTAAVGIVDRAKPVSVTPAEPLILIDPGHGGAYGGAVAPDGTQEKEINLAISLPLADMLRVMGYQVSLTRTTDDMVGGVGSTMRERKVNDTKNRLAQAEQAAITVSIHQNKFTQSQYDGTQVFYSGNHEESRLLASAIRESVTGLLQPDNTRELKKGDSNIYLLTTPNSAASRIRITSARWRLPSRGESCGTGRDGADVKTKGQRGMAPKAKTVYVCSSCGFESPRWGGKCPSCGEWNTLSEEVRAPQRAAASGSAAGRAADVRSLRDIHPEGEQRTRTGLSELDRVCLLYTSPSPRD